MLKTAIQENACDAPQTNFDAAADALELTQDIREMIKFPERVLTVTVPVRMDNGHVHPSEGVSV